MIGNDQDQGAAAERVGEVGERRVCDHDGDVGERPGAVSYTHLTLPTTPYV